MVASPGDVGAIVAGAIAVFVVLGTNGAGDAGLVLILSLFVFNTDERVIIPVNGTPDP